MAFGLSDHYDWDAASVLVDDAAGRRASTQAAYNDDATDFHSMVQFARSALNFLSHQWPGVPYPYEKSTIFRGFADMEYPMMVNDNSNADTSFSRFVVAHEIAHTYFPFYMGINETRYGFMDEGWATTFEYLINQVDMGKPAAEKLYQQFRVAGWIRDPSPLEDLPIITPEDVLKGAAYGNNAYGKASLGYLAVKDLLGDAMFRKCLQAFIARWHGKHPIPWDFFNTFNDVSAENLNWFWRDWYFSNDYIDLAVAGVTHTARGYYGGGEEYRGHGRAVRPDPAICRRRRSRHRARDTAGVAGEPAGSVGGGAGRQGAAVGHDRRRDLDGCGPEQQQLEERQSLVVRHAS